MSIREELRAMRACRQGISWAKDTGVTSLDELWCALVASDRHDWLVWLALHASAVPRESVKAFLDVTVDRAIRRAIDVYKDPTFVAWAHKWLSGEDRKEDTVRAAEKADLSLAAWAAWAAVEAHGSALASVTHEEDDRWAAFANYQAASRAAWAALAATDAASRAPEVEAALWLASEMAWAARADEIRQQADWWRARPNPFKEVTR